VAASDPKRTWCERQSMALQTFFVTGLRGLFWDTCRRKSTMVERKMLSEF